MKEILLVTLSNIGDVILTTPVIASLKSQFPGSFLTVVVGPRARGVLEGSAMIGELVTYDKRGGLGEQWKFLQHLRRKSYDLVIDLRHTAIPFLVRARKRSPHFGRTRVAFRRGRHLDLLSRMGLAAGAREPFDFFSKEEARSALKKVQDLVPQENTSWILVAPVAASSTKTWRLDGFRDVVLGLLEASADPVLLAGAPGDREKMDPLTRLHPARVFNLAGETTLRELAALVARARLLLTNDSAVMHLGHELDRPVAAIFGPTDPEKYGRLGPHFKILREPVFCSPCERAQCRFERQACFEDLPASSVLAACQELLRDATSN